MYVRIFVVQPLLRWSLAVQRARSRISPAQEFVVFARTCIWWNSLLFPSLSWPRCSECTYRSVHRNQYGRVKRYYWILHVTNFSESIVERSGWSCHRSTRNWCIAQVIGAAGEWTRCGVHVDVPRSMVEYGWRNSSRVFRPEYSNVSLEQRRLKEKNDDREDVWLEFGEFESSHSGGCTENLKEEFSFRRWHEQKRSAFKSGLRTSGMWRIFSPSNRIVLPQHHKRIRKMLGGLRLSRKSI